MVLFSNGTLILGKHMLEMALEDISRAFGLGVNIKERVKVMGGQTFSLGDYENNG